MRQLHGRLTASNMGVKKRPCYSPFTLANFTVSDTCRHQLATRVADKNILVGHLSIKRARASQARFFGLEHSNNMKLFVEYSTKPKPKQTTRKNTVTKSRRLYWERASVRDTHAAKAGFWRQSFSLEKFAVKNLPKMQIWIGWNYITPLMPPITLVNAWPSSIDTRHQYILLLTCTYLYLIVLVDVG